MFSPLLAEENTPSGFLNSRPLSSYTFSEATPAYDPADQSNHLGDFQAGLSVRIVKAYPAEGQWKVSYERRTDPALKALVHIPRVDGGSPVRWRDFREKAGEFPLLLFLLNDSQRMLLRGQKADVADALKETMNVRLSGLENRNRWKWSDRYPSVLGEDVNGLRIVSDEDESLRLQFHFTRQYDKVGSAYGSIRDMTVVRRNFQRFFSELAETYDRRQHAYPSEVSEEGEKRFFLPNFISVHLEYDLRNIILTIESYNPFPEETEN